VFSIQALARSPPAALYTAGWNTLVLLTVPFLLVLAVGLVFLRRQLDTSACSSLRNQAPTNRVNSMLDEKRRAVIMYSRSDRRPVGQVQRHKRVHLVATSGAGNQPPPGLPGTSRWKRSTDPAA
jgi:uncharacterized protein (DUF58 family)